MAIEVYSGNFGTKELNHLLKRTLFGAKRSDINSLVGQSVSQVVDLLLKDLPLPNHQLIITMTPIIQMQMF